MEECTLRATSMAGRASTDASGAAGPHGWRERATRPTPSSHDARCASSAAARAAVRVGSKATALPANRHYRRRASGSNRREMATSTCGVHPQEVSPAMALPQPLRQASSLALVPLK